MDLGRLSAEERLKICRIYFFDVLLSLIGTAIWTIALVAWITTYYTKRIVWGDFGDRISFNIPPGRL
ncbi:hypothetical protein X801_03469, partial [Opisthorchis viverrini]